MATVLSIITSSMRKIGALTMNETPSAEEAAAGLEMLNDLIDSWSTESLLIMSRDLEQFPLVGGTGAYTIGTGGDFNTDRPTLIVSAYTTSGTTDYGIKEVSDEVFASISQKSTQTSFPDVFNYNNAYPLGTIKLWPIPSASYMLNLLTEKPITSFSATTDLLDLPNGWNRALIYNLAMEMSPEYGQQISGDISTIAATSKAAIKKVVTKNRTMDVPSSPSSYRNIYTGYYT